MHQHVKTIIHRKAGEEQFKNISFSKYNLFDASVRAKIGCPQQLKPLHLMPKALCLIVIDYLILDEMTTANVDMLFAIPWFEFCEANYQRPCLLKDTIMINPCIPYQWILQDLANRYQFNSQWIRTLTVGIQECILPSIVTFENIAAANPNFAHSCTHECQSHNRNNICKLSKFVKKFYEPCDVSNQSEVQMLHTKYKQEKFLTSDPSYAPVTSPHALMVPMIPSITPSPADNELTKTCKGPLTKEKLRFIHARTQFMTPYNWQLLAHNRDLSVEVLEMYAHSLVHYGLRELLSNPNVPFCFLDKCKTQIFGECARRPDVLLALFKSQTVARHFRDLSVQRVLLWHLSI
jgi:hypothetical protein